MNEAIATLTLEKAQGYLNDDYRVEIVGSGWEIAEIVFEYPTDFRVHFRGIPGAGVLRKKTLVAVYRREEGEIPPSNYDLPPEAEAALDQLFAPHQERLL